MKTKEEILAEIARLTEQLHVSFPFGEDWDHAYERIESLKWVLGIDQ
jgi:hypothetical protein